LKQGLICSYVTSAKDASDPSISHQLEVLKERLLNLEQRKAQLAEGSGAKVNFTHVLTFSSLITANKYLSNVIIYSDKSKNTDEIPVIIEEQFEKEKRKISDIELMKHDLKVTNTTITDLIKTILIDKTEVWNFVNHFFESELYLGCSFIDKNAFYLRAHAFLSKIKTEEKINKHEYGLAGIILMILRISSVSFYNCGYNSTQSSKLFGPDVSTLAILCLDETTLSMNQTSDDISSLMLLIYFYQGFSPESLGPVPFKDRVNVYELYQRFVESRLNCEPEPKDPEALYRKRMWYQLLEVEKMEFIYSAYPMQIDSEKYTTELPKVHHTGLDEDVINEVNRERYGIQSLLFKFSKMLNNVRTPSTLDSYENILELFRQHNMKLDAILKMDSSTKQSRWKKTAKFLNFLDLGSLEYMLSIHIFLHYDNASAPEDVFNRLLVSLTRIVDQFTTLCYFLDSKQEHYYNLHDHFGYNIQLIPSIIQSLHKAFQFQTTILAKLCFQEGSLTTPTAERLKEVMYQNSKIIISSWGRISDRYLYAKRIYMVLSFIVTKIFQADLTLMPEYTKRLSSLDDIRPLSQVSCEIILKNLARLNGDKDISQDAYKEPLTDYFEEVINNYPADFLRIDTSTIENLEKFLNSDSFLSTEKPVQ
jgi:hypothetical protein